MECTNDHTLVLACVITNSLLNATPYGPSTSTGRWYRTIRGQIQLSQDISENIVYAIVGLLIQFDPQLIGLDSLIFLGQTPLQSEVQLAPTNRLCKAIRYAFLIVRPLVGIKCRQTLRDSIGKAHLLSKNQQLIGAYLDRDLDARFPTPFFHVEHTGQHVGLPLDWLRPEEERDSVRWDVLS